MDRKYTTIQRDTFDSIAYRKFQDSHLCRELMAANISFMDVLFFEPGITLNLPETGKRKKTGRLPPWYGENND